MSSSQPKIIKFCWDITKLYQFNIKQMEMCSFLGHHVRFYVKVISDALSHHRVYVWVMSEWCLTFTLASEIEVFCCLRGVLSRGLLFTSRLCTCPDVYTFVRCTLSPPTARIRCGLRQIALTSCCCAWRGGSMVGRRIRDRKVAGSTPGLCATT